MPYPKSSPLENLEATLLHKLLNTAGPDDIRAPNEAEVNQFATLVEAVNKEKNKRDRLYFTIICAGGVLAATFAWNFPLMALNFAFDTLLLIGICCDGDLKYSKLPRLKESLLPLADLKKCERALSLAEKHEACTDYRQQVLGYGREFRELDLTLMEALAAKEEQKQEAAQAKQRCQELHGLTT